MSKTALLVEDNEDAQITSNRVLRLKGYEPELASTLEEAMSLLRSRKHDVYVIDGRFPTKRKGDPIENGVVFYKAVIDQYPGANAYMFTNLGEKATKELNESGIRAYEKHTMLEIDF